MVKSKWMLDPAHSSVDFSVKHMMIANVKGTFNQFDATIEADPDDLTSASIELNIDLASVDTRNEDRDNHLRSADFFNVEKNPKMTFTTTNIERKGEGEYNVTGNLTIAGVTKSETISVTYEGSGVDPWGNVKVGFTADGSLNRSDYGLTWNSALETGGVLVGDKIKISLDLQASKAE
ncbi:polyisoprenoid-binding protein YceI [Cytobacillus horneckiae]|uniref:Polyisoprenoid-binding protein n=1 Tax=Cytobacillus horneckiae TaxID=549687 RepID=A0A2N0ZI29_9BACI|nr:YceI family protein [Cytobacillus horneckiae]MBN6886836.1 polyisoprenoid-binding protein [Cytobacillus horneckiae]MEC1158008.1 YceI family protein [Cytobacillus horneckiae]MED2937067.1 YceI family protein [Cytobacillus horneckiae]PKG29179.1 polyisoprenoid-binding protein [Cytobacillus horneckiae]